MICHFRYTVHSNKFKLEYLKILKKLFFYFSGYMFLSLKVNILREFLYNGVQLLRVFEVMSAHDNGKKRRITRADRTRVSSKIKPCL